MRRSRIVVGLLALGGIACARPIGTESAAGALGIRGAVAWGMPAAASLTVGLVVENRGAAADTLVSVASKAGMAMLHTTSPQGMVALDAVPVLAGGTIVLGLDGPHIMIDEVATGTWTVGQVRVTLQFRRAGPVEVSLPIVQYSVAIKELRRAAR